MRIHLQCCLFLRHAISFCTAAVISNGIIPLPTAIPTVEDFNVSALPDMPDQDFRYVAAYREPVLPNTACIMAGVSAMRELALLDINSLVSDTEKWTHPDYPGVVVSLAGERGERLTVRWAMWLVHAGVKDMMLRTRYQTSTFFGWFRDVKIGHVMFDAIAVEAKTAPQLPRMSPIASTTSGSRVSFNFSLPGPEAANPAANDDLHAQVEYVGKAMDSRDSLEMIIWLLMSLGPRDNEPLAVYQCTIPAITSNVVTIWNAVKRPGSHPYLLNSGDMVNMIARLAVILLREDKWQEMNVVISDDGVVIARGAIRTKPLSGPIVLPATTDVSTS